MTKTKIPALHSAGDVKHANVLLLEKEYARVRCTLCAAVVLVEANEVPRLAADCDHVSLTCPVCRVEGTVVKILCRRITEETEAIPF